MLLLLYCCCITHTHAHTYARWSGRLRMCVRVFVRHFELNAGKNCKNHLLHCFKGTRPIGRVAHVNLRFLPVGGQLKRTRWQVKKQTIATVFGAERCDTIWWWQRQREHTNTSAAKNTNESNLDGGRRSEGGGWCGQCTAEAGIPLSGYVGILLAGWQRLAARLLSSVTVSFRFDSKLDFEIILKDCIDSLELFMVVQ